MDKPDFMPAEFVTKSVGNRELKGIYKALDDHKKDILKLHELPMSSDCAKEIIMAEKSFRYTITRELREFIELNCANCPAGQDKQTCEIDNCPMKIIERILYSTLDQLNQILPGGV